MRRMRLYIRREAVAKAVDFLKQKGMKVTVVSNKELDRMCEKARPAMQQFKDLQTDLERFGLAFAAILMISVSAAGWAETSTVDGAIFRWHRGRPFRQLG